MIWNNQRLILSPSTHSILIDDDNHYAKLYSKYLFASVNFILNF